ncbi:hypothetical protein B0T20DRAFT_49431 [Sordaria brevicollis]|uniref:Uncharacterized protein n=1 Tax=Sordaria brevicollis TaxID=83679 RepID=A0AAE0P9U1_SORBR|nr:hypothetical protein B0T20DRAFT_49431 [Sordaria brevicollis]
MLWDSTLRYGVLGFCFALTLWTKDGRWTTEARRMVARGLMPTKRFNRTRSKHRLSSPSCQQVIDQVLDWQSPIDDGVRLVATEVIRQRRIVKLVSRVPRRLRDQDIMVINCGHAGFGSNPHFDV